MVSKPFPFEGYLLARVLAQAPHAGRLAAQLFGIAPCEKCDYVKEHCKCHEDGKGCN